MYPWLSSQIIDGSSLDSLLESDRLSTFSELGNNPHESMSLSVLRIGSSAIQHWMSSVYSSSIEMSAIFVCSLLDQCIGTPAKSRNRVYVRIIDAIHQRSHYCSMRQVKGFYLVSC
jgi:hypothetical protein